MKKFFAVILTAVFFLLSCGGNKHQTPSDVCDLSIEDDSFLEEEDIDSDLLFEQEAMPKAADETFDDFFFNFISSRKLQLERIDFPLLATIQGRVDTLVAEQWRTEHFFLEQGFYTIISDNEAQQDLRCDTSVRLVTVECIDFSKKSVRRYIFERLERIWRMTSIDEEHLFSDHNSSFLIFYNNFSSDSLFRRQSLGNTIEFISGDTEDGFEETQGIITPDTWEAFAPDLPMGRIYNICYGEQSPSSDTKILTICGIANGWESELTFRLSDGRWTLVRLVN